jgi:hypothetical protein
MELVETILEGLELPPLSMTETETTIASATLTKPKLLVFWIGDLQQNIRKMRGLHEVVAMKPCILGEPIVNRDLHLYPPLQVELGLINL